MKYGVALDRNGNLRKGTEREFTNDHWLKIQKMKKPRWIPFPKKKVFISFYDQDRKKMQILKK